MCPRCCRGKRTSRLHIPTGVVTRGAAQEVVVPNAAAAASVAAAPLQQREQVVTINPVGIAMQALSRAIRPTSASTMSGESSGGDAAAARSGGGGGHGGGGEGAAADFERTFACVLPGGFRSGSSGELAAADAVGGSGGSEAAPANDAPRALL